MNITAKTDSSSAKQFLTGFFLRPGEKDNSTFLNTRSKVLKRRLYTTSVRCIISRDEKLK